MDVPAQPTLDLGPDWVVAEMPPGYRNRVAEIQRLMSDLEEMGRFTRLLCDTGPRLAGAVRDLFATLKYDVEPLPLDSGSGVLVRLDGGNRLMVIVAAGASQVQKKSPEVGLVFHVMQEMAEEFDRVVILTNTVSDRPPQERGEALSPDAAAFLKRMGAVHVTGPTCFALWKLSLQEPGRAREQVQRLHAHEGGTFALPAMG